MYLNICNVVELRNCASVLGRSVGQMNLNYDNVIFFKMGSSQLLVVIN